MSAKGKVPPPYEGRSVQAPGMMRHGPFPGLEGPGSRGPMEPHLPLEISEKHIALQEAELEQLSSDNHRLAATHVALREDLAAAQQEMLRIKAHIRSIQTESDIQIRLLLDKISKMGADIRAGEGVKKELQQAHMEAHGLVVSRQELATQIQKSSQELQRIRSDVKRLPDMHAELDSLRQEHQRLRAAFEYEKGLNTQKVEQMQVMDKNMLGMAREVEKLRAEVLNAEKRTHGKYCFLYLLLLLELCCSEFTTMKLEHGNEEHVVYPPSNSLLIPHPCAYCTLPPIHSINAFSVCTNGMLHTVPNYGGPYVNPDSSYPHPQGSVACVDGYGRPYPQMGIGFAGENVSPYTTSGPVNPGVSGAPVSVSGTSAVWDGTYDPNLARR